MNAFFNKMVEKWKIDDSEFHLGSLVFIVNTRVFFFEKRNLTFDCFEVLRISDYLESLLKFLLDKHNEKVNNLEGRKIKFSKESRECIYCFSPVKKQNFIDKNSGRKAQCFTFESCVVPYFDSRSNQKNGEESISTYSFEKESQKELEIALGIFDNMLKKEN